MTVQLNSTTQESIAPLPDYRSILIAADSSDHANRAVDEAVELAALWQCKITGTHVYAAQMHDVRFRQMEGGLPEQFRAEQELERQRDVHDDLITRGLSIITDSYLDQAEKTCNSRNLELNRRSLEGKNYRALVTEANSGHYDLLVMGALGLGAIEGSRLGTVCDRVVRRVDIDTLVIRDPQRCLADGPIVVALDGSARAYGGLLTAFTLAEFWNVPVQVVAAFDPYYHYVAFNRIAGVLSEEAGKVFRFQEQEKLHEDIIDSGLAKIYQGHLDVAQSIANDYNIKIDTVLLDGKAHEAIEKHLSKVNPSLLVIGKLGIHADPELDIGGNAENLLRNVNCAVLLSQRTHQPQIEVIAEVTTSWTHEAEEQIKRVPGFVQNMARMAVLRYSQERGHTVVTARIVEEATAELCPNNARQAMAEIVSAYDNKTQADANNPMGGIEWSSGATTMLNSIENNAVRENIQRRAEKKARLSDAPVVEVEHIKSFLIESPLNSATPSLHWKTDALARLLRVPEGFMRETSRQRVEEYALELKVSEITLELVEDALAQARESMQGTLTVGAQNEQSGGNCPFGYSAENSAPTVLPILWESAAEKRLQKVPSGFMRKLTRQRVEAFARRKGVSTITAELLTDKYAEWAEGSEKQQQTMPWDKKAEQRIQRIPEFVRGMVIKEMEQCARDLGKNTVSLEVLEKGRDTWSDKGVFHSDSKAGLYTS